MQFITVLLENKQTQTLWWTDSLEHFPFHLFSFSYYKLPAFTDDADISDTGFLEAGLLSPTFFIREWQGVNEVCLVSSQEDQVQVEAVPDLPQLHKLSLPSCSAAQGCESPAQCCSKPSCWLVMNTFSCAPGRRLQMGPWPWMVMGGKTVMHGGAVTQSRMMHSWEQGSLCMNQCEFYHSKEFECSFRVSTIPKSKRTSWCDHMGMVLPYNTIISLFSS